MQDESARTLAQGLFLLLQTIKAHGAEHPMSQEAAERVHASLHGECSLQFVAGVMFCDRRLVSVSREEHQRFQVVARACHTLEFQELTLRDTLSIEGSLKLGQWLARGAVGARLDVSEMRIPGVITREIQETTWGEEFEEIDPALLALSQVALAMQEATALRKDGPWDWRNGFSVIRRLERAMDASLEHALQGLEMEEGAWTPTRRAVGVAFDVIAALRHLEVQTSIVRACGHAALALGVHGLEAHHGRELDASAKSVFASMTSNLQRMRTGIPPHQLRTLSVIEHLRSTEPHQWMSVLFLLQLCYDLEWERCPPGVSFTLTRADLLAIATQEMGARFPPAWVRILVAIHGDAPAGAYVRLPDQRLGVILGPDTHTSNIQVLTGGEIVLVSPPLKLVSAAQAHGLWETP